MASRDLGWRPLPLACSTLVPPLLVSADFAAAAYAVRVTDMVNVWAESLDREAICLRARSEHTTIDPSDSPENMAKLLSSMKFALDSSHCGTGDETGLSLSPAATTDGMETNGLVLVLTCAIPRLDPLRWPVHLAKSSQPAIATDLVLPLVRGLGALEQELASLLLAIDRKDAVIGKLSDKLEALGVGLDQVFVPLSKRRKNQRADAMNKVPGLAPFDRLEWQADLERETGRQLGVGQLLAVVLGSQMGSRIRPASELDPNLAPDGWWRRFRCTTSLVAHDTPTIEAVSQDGSPSIEGDEDEDASFQNQEVPPRIRSQSPGRLRGTRRKNTSWSLPSDRLDGKVQVSPKNHHFATARHGGTRNKATLRLGTIVGSKGAIPSGFHALESADSKYERLRAAAARTNGVELDSEAPHGLIAPYSAKKAAKLAPCPGPDRPGIGSLGRGVSSTALRANKGFSSTELLEGEAGSIDGLTCQGKALGDEALEANSETEDRLGHRREARYSIKKVEERKRGGDWWQEQADRRREELKRELDKKVKSPPAKRKKQL